MTGPQELYDQYSQNATARTKRSLAIVHAVCREQHEDHKSSDFSVATIGKLVHKRGGPSPAAIRNKQGAKYRALILAWGKHVGGNTVKVSSVAKSQIEQALLGIEDPGLRAIALNLAADNRKLRRQVNLQRDELQQSRVIDLRPIVQQRETQILSPGASIGLVPSEIEALGDAVSDRKIVDEGWELASGGRISTRNGRQIYPPSYISAIRKVLSLFP